MENKNKLVVMIMGENCEKHIEMCLNSVKDADSIVYCDGGSKDNTKQFVQRYFNNLLGLNNKLEVIYYNIIQNEFNQDDPTMNGKQRNFYLSYLKEHYMDSWVLCLDADEVVDDDGINKIKEWIQTALPGMYSVRMEHFIGDMLHVDATRGKHFVPHRLFKVHNNLFYPEVEHPVLSYKDFTDSCGYYNGTLDITTLWHLAYILEEAEMFKERYERNLKFSNIHGKEFLDGWYGAHIFGNYPKRDIQLTDIPKVILEHFHFNKDQFYFMNRGLEAKHPLMVKQWYDYFNPQNVLDLGAGRGPYLYFWHWFLPDEAEGIELSNWAVENSLTYGVFQGDICDENEYYMADLITAIDVLEHLSDEQLDKTLKNMIKHGKRFLFSVPVKGDPNLLNDKTHKQFKTRDEWIKFWESYGLKITMPPENWLFREQLFIGEKNDRP
jgi:glycosyltransferase involved in cell wall biosynthesis